MSAALVGVQPTIYGIIPAHGCDNADTGAQRARMAERRRARRDQSPGTGKTYAVKRLAYSLIGEKNLERVQMVQFHQSYGYEDFIMGYRPKNEGFELVYGPFYNFCKKALASHLWLLNNRQNH